MYVHFKFWFNSGTGVSLPSYVYNECSTTVIYPKDYPKNRLPDNYAINVYGDYVLTYYNISKFFQ